MVIYTLAMIFFALVAFYLSFEIFVKIRNQTRELNRLKYMLIADTEIISHQASVISEYEMKGSPYVPYGCVHNN